MRRAKPSGSGGPKRRFGDTGSSAFNAKRLSQDGWRRIGAHHHSGGCEPVERARAEFCQTADRKPAEGLDNHCDSLVRDGRSIGERCLTLGSSDEHQKRPPNIIAITRTRGLVLLRPGKPISHSSFNQTERTTSFTVYLI